MTGKPIVKPDDTDTAGAIADALDESKYDPEGDEDLASFDKELNEDPDDDEVAEPSTAQGSEDSDTVEPATPVAADVPDSYWGTDLTGIPAEKRAEIVAHFEKQDGTIRKLQDRLATPLEREAPVVDDVTEPTDEELLQVLGLDPETTAGPERTALVTMARNQLALETRVEQLATVETGRAVENSWSKQLVELEEAYGKLPGTRDQQLRYAAEESIVSPADLYFKLSAPVKKEVEGLAAAARRDAAKRVESGGLRPRSAASEPLPVKPGMSMRDAVKAAAMSAQKETGLSWKQAVKRVLTAKPGDEK